MSKCGPVNSQSARASSEVPIHRPLRVPTINSVLSAISASRRLGTTLHPSTDNLLD